MSPTANSATMDNEVEELVKIPRFHDGIFPFEAPNYRDTETHKAQLSLRIRPDAARLNVRGDRRNLFEFAGKKAYRPLTVLSKEFRDLNYIAVKYLHLATPDELLAQYCEKTEIPVELRAEFTGTIAKLVATIREGGKVLADTTPPTPWVERTKSKPAMSRPTADVVLPDHAPELWRDSPEKVQFDAEQAKLDLAVKAKSDSGKAKLDQAVIAFTNRVYSPWFKPDQTGMAVSETKPLDSELYEELKATRNRMNGRKEAFPFPAVGVRNKALVEKILAGELAPPTSLTLYRTLDVVARKMGLSLISNERATRS